MKRGLVIALLTGCVGHGDPGSEWLPADMVDGELAANIGPAPTLRAAAGCTLRIATFNVHYAGDPENIAAHIRASTEIRAADVILLQETRSYDGEARSRTERIADGLAMTWAYAPARTLDEGGTHGNAILSRWPLANVAVRWLPYIEQPYHPEQRNAIAADIVLGDRHVRVVDVHLDVRLTPVDRVRQLDPAVRDTDEQLVVGGDFNTNPWTWVGSIVPLTSSEAVLGQDQAAVIDDFLAARRFTGAIAPDVNTMRVPGLSMRLDNLYARGLTILAAGVEHVDGSDHWPLWFDIDVCAE
jgi:endonuclease/exonuclease/phosphatase family metal-dependent hydrolase